jgi:hypothetical protein
MITYVAWREPHDPRQPQGRPVILAPAQVRATLDYLRRCREARAEGRPVSYTTDPEWLVDMAINRRAGWPEPTHERGSCMPVGDKFPKRAENDGPLRQFAQRFNSCRWHPRELEVRWLPRKVRERIEHRVSYDRDL